MEQKKERKRRTVGETQGSDLFTQAIHTLTIHHTPSTIRP